ncbi:MAG: flagellar hook protein FlgE [Holophagales bacterium]|jgi:flagellar hook protein FlgE|nr:flagellar hook protein FlgE [Holophagales bacterium]
MSIASAFYTALSGLSVNSASLSVIGNNLANLNTIGFKGSSTTFQDLFYTNLGASPYQGNGNPSQVGLGAKVGAVMQNFGQSTFQSTSNPTDMALQGQGFFYMKLVTGGYGHTRAGNFTVNQFGFVVDPSGNRLQGYNRDSNGNIDTTMGSTDIRLPIGETVSAFATTQISFTTNLDAKVTAPNDRYTSPTKIYDSLGTQHNLMITYDKIANNQWVYYVWSPDSVPLTSAPSASGLGSGNVLAEGTLDFNPNGSLNTITRAVDANLSAALDANPTFNISWSNGASSQDVEWIINTMPSGGTPNFKLTQVDSASGTSDSSQNGYGAGTIMGLTVDQNGFIIGTFNNGQTYPLAQVALSIFTNNNGLQKAGENIWKETIASGPANVGTANDLGRGAVLGAHTEMSNVDVADEFTRLIITQRGYQANSRIVTTSDEMMQETLSLKR